MHFHDHSPNPLLEILSKEANKTIVFLGDFNIDLLNSSTSDHINIVLKDLTSNYVQPQIFLHTRVFKNSKTLMSNLFCNIPNSLAKTAIYGNISSSMSDHLPQFLCYQISFPILCQLNMTLCPMTGETFTNNYFLRILKRQIGIKISN